MKTTSRLPPPERAFARPRHVVYRVTQRQNEVLYWISLGLTVAAVGRQMNVSENTAKSLLRDLYRKLDVGNASEAVRVGFETGLLSPRVERLAEVVERDVGARHRYAVVRGQPAQADLRVPGPDGA